MFFGGRVEDEVFENGKGEHFIEGAVFKVDGVCIFLADAFGKKLGERGIGNGVNGEIEGFLVHA